MKVMKNNDKKRRFYPDKEWKDMNVSHFSVRPHIDLEGNTELVTVRLNALPTEKGLLQAQYRGNVDSSEH